jgi:hypothetical protein
VCGAMLDADVAGARDAARARDRPSMLRPDPVVAASACSTGCALLVGVPALLACIGLIRVGNHAKWTSDGPGILFVMIAVLVTGLVAAAALGTALVAFVPGLGKLLRWFD